MTNMRRKIGTTVLSIGIALTAYAAFAFFFFPNFPYLPPNNDNGRLPSLYLLFAGMATMLIGLPLRDFRGRGRK